MDDGNGPLSTLAAAYHDRERWAVAAHQRGQKVIGYVSNNVPAELIWASGAFGVQLTGIPGETPTGDRYMEDFHEGHVRSLFDRFLTGHFDFADAVIIPRSSEGYLQLYYYLLEVRKWEPQQRFPEILLFDLLQTPTWSSSRYDRGRVEVLAQRLAAITGTPVSREAIRRAIDRDAKTRSLLRRLNDLRRDNPSRVSGEQALHAFAASMFMDPEDHAALVSQVLDSSGALSPVSGPRIMIKGSGHDNTEFYRVVEACGARVIADDHPWGERLLDAPDSPAYADEFEYLTAKYQQFSVSPRLYPQDREDRRFMALVEAGQVEGVIFYLEENDDTLGWDYPAQRRMLDERGVPSLFMPFQRYRYADAERQRQTVRDWLERAALGEAPVSNEAGAHA
jgi:benzoyl-CoA reductase/2-hydroxyglutaryl-CoA dehydratase subunit BcrC/BadD/HgdB